MALTHNETRSNYLINQIARELGAIVGHDQVTTDKAKRIEQASDWSWMSKYLLSKNEELPIADLVVSPKSTEEVSKVVALANEYRMPVIPRGGGSGTQSGTFALYGGIALDLKRLNKVIDIDENSMIVTVEAGLDGSELEKVLNAKGLTMPHYPGSHFFGATIGGCLAARGSGVVSTKYGKAEDLVLQIEAVMANGTVIDTLPVPSHASGPGIIQTLVGSEGTLGVITKAAMRLEHLPESRVFLSYGFKDVNTGIEAARLIMTKRWKPAVIRLYDEADTKKLSEFLNLGVQGVLMVIMCDGAKSLTDLESKEIDLICTGVGGKPHGPQVGQNWWDGKYEPFKHGNIPAPPMIYGTTDTCARFNDLPAIYKAKKEVVEKQFAHHKARYTAHFSHWFPWGGMIYDRFYVDNPPTDIDEAMKLHDDLWNAAIDASLKNGGTLNEHHGVGLKLGRFMKTQHGSSWEFMLGLKKAWDPNGIMNPGKLGFGPPGSA